MTSKTDASEALYRRLKSHSNEVDLADITAMQEIADDAESAASWAAENEGAYWAGAAALKAALLIRRLLVTL